MRRLSALDADDIAALGAKGAAALEAEQMVSLAPEAVAGFGAAQAAALQPEALAALSPSQVARLGASALGAMHAEQLSALSPKQVAALDARSIAAIGKSAGGARDAGASAAILAWAQRAASELSADRGAAAAAARAALQAVAKDQSSPQHRSTWSNGGRAGVAYRRGAAGDNAGEVACVDVLSDALAALGFEAEDEPEAEAGSEAEADMNTNGAIEDHVEATFGATLPPCHQVASIGTAQNEDGREKSNSTAWDEVEDSVGAADCGFEDDEGALSDDLSDARGSLVEVAEPWRPHPHGVAADDDNSRDDDITDDVGDGSESVASVCGDDGVMFYVAGDRGDGRSGDDSEVRSSWRVC